MKTPGQILYEIQRKQHGWYHEWDEKSCVVKNTFERVAKEFLEKLDKPKEHINIDDLPPVFWIRPTKSNKIYLINVITYEPFDTVFSGTGISLSFITAKSHNWQWSADRKTWNNF